MNNYKYIKYRPSTHNIYIKQIGGAKDYFKNNIKVHILANITDPSIIRLLNDRRNALNLWDLSGGKQFHITLFQFHINGNHPDAYIFKDNWDNLIKQWYNETFGQNVILQYRQGQYDLLGQEKKYLVKTFEPLAKFKTVITDFRKKIYKYIQKKIKKKKKMYTKEKDGVKYHIISFGGRKLLSVPDYYFGIGQWTPHISIADMDEIEKYNKHISEKYNSLQSKNEQIKTIIDPILQANLSSLPDINMNLHIKSIKVSFHNKIDADWTFGLDIIRS